MNYQLTCGVDAEVICGILIIRFGKVFSFRMKVRLPSGYVRFKGKWRIEHDKSPRSASYHNPNSIEIFLKVLSRLFLRPKKTVKLKLQLSH